MGQSGCVEELQQLHLLAAGRNRRRFHEFPRIATVSKNKGLRFILFKLSAGMCFCLLLPFYSSV